MQVASILSDLTSLRVCDHSAALELVTVHQGNGTESSAVGASLDPKSDAKAQDDPDMQRAVDLVDLHYGVKLHHMRSEDAGMKQARKDVDRVLERLESKRHDV